MDQRKIRLFQATFCATGNLAAAARAAELTLPAAKKLRQKLTPTTAVPSACTAADDPALARALARAVDALESEAVRRALEGVEIPVFHQGRECGSTIKHSDPLLMFLLKTLRPDRYASTREPVAQTPARTVLLDIDLSAAEDGDQA